MKVKYIPENSLLTIKSNLPDIYKKVIIQGETIQAAMGDEHLIKESSFSTDLFNLDMSSPSNEAIKTDFENIKRVYGHLKFLTDSQATDERIWAAYTLSHFIEYMKYRWPAENYKKLENKYVFTLSPQRSALRNGIARLWWIGRISYDETRQDPFEITSFICRHTRTIEAMCLRNYFNNKKVGHTVIQTLIDAEKKGLEINSKLIEEVTKYVNLLSGVYILDAMDPEAISRKITEKFGI